MLNRLLSLFKNVLFLWAICLALNIITFLFIYFKIHPEGKTVALFYNVIVGVEWYGQGKNLYLIPLVGFVISAVNFTLYRTLKGTRVLLPFLAIFISLCVQTILLLAAVSLSTVN